MKYVFSLKSSSLWFFVNELVSVLRRKTTPKLEEKCSEPLNKNLYTPFQSIDIQSLLRYDNGCANFSTILSCGDMQILALTEGREYKQKEPKPTTTKKSIHSILRHVSISKEVEYDWKPCNSWIWVRKFIWVSNQL